MIMRSFLITSLLSATLFLFPQSSFAGAQADIQMSGQYWQRVSTASALYMQGPKAQQILNRDIARCVVELRELERLGAVKNAIPEYAEGIVLSTDEAKLYGWDTPQRDDELLAEQPDYVDFEGCMLSKGWERIMYVPYDVAKQAENNYLHSHTDYRKKFDSQGNPVKRKPSSDYENLNQ